MSKKPWFKCFPSDFLGGVADLSPNEIAVYTVVLMRIYDEDGPIQDDPIKIARRCNMRRNVCEQTLDGLVGGGKLYRIEGCISNERCEKELSSRTDVNTKASLAAQHRWSKEAEKPKENNGTPMRPHKKTSENEMLSRSQKLDTRKNPPICPPKRKKYSYTADFEEWWLDYPKKGRLAKPECFNKYTAAVASGEVAPAEILSAVARYGTSEEVRRGYVCHAKRWLKEERWTQDYSEPENAITAEIRKFVAPGN